MMRIEITQGQASWMLMKVSAQCLAYLMTVEPTEMQTIAYNQVHKPLFDLLQKKVQGA